ncbi:MAG: type IV pilin protein [Burkholderiaceae bacterium]
MTDDSFQAGFSLVELMVALAIAAVIAAFALPAYRNHTLRSYLPEMSSSLQLSALRLEQYYQDHRSYLKGTDCGVTLPSSEHFAYTCASPEDGQSFLITATGLAAMAEFSYTINHQGQTRTVLLPERWGKTPSNCWVMKPGVVC